MIFTIQLTRSIAKGLRRWIIWSYGEDPHNTSEERFQELIINWNGYEAAALEFLYVNYVLKGKEEQAKKSSYLWEAGASPMGMPLARDCVLKPELGNEHQPMAFILRSFRAFCLLLPFSTGLHPAFW